MILVDTSAFFALVDPGDDFNPSAREKLETFIEGQKELMTHNYILAETYALIHKRIGFEACQRLYRDVYQMCRVLWVSQSQHERASKTYANQRIPRYSFVDCVSFEMMRAHGIKRYFGYDGDFRNAGFEPA